MFLDLYFMIWPQGCIASCHYLWISKSIKVVSILNLKVMQKGNLTYNFLVPLTLTKIDSKFCSLTYIHLKLSIMNSFPFIFSEEEGLRGEKRKRDAEDDGEEEDD